MALRLLLILFVLSSYPVGAQKNPCQTAREFEICASNAIKNNSAEEALRCAKKTAYYLNSCDSTKARHFEHELALAFLRNNQKDSAIYYSRRVLQYSKSTQNDSLRIRALSTLGMLYNQEGAFERALEVFRQSYDYYRALPGASNTKLTISAINVAQCYLNLGRLTEGLPFLIEAKEVSLNEPSLSLKGYVFGVAYSYEKVLDSTKALESISKSYEFSKQAKNVPSSIESLLLLLNEKKKLGQAVDSLELNYIESNYIKLKNSNLLLNALSFLASEQYEKANYEKAWEFKQLEDSVSQEIITQNNLKKIQNLERLNEQIRLEKAISENELLTREKRYFKTVSYLLCILIFVVILFWILRAHLVKKSILMLSEKEDQISSLFKVKKKDGVSDKIFEVYMACVQIITSEELFKNPNFKVKELANKVNSNSRYVSKAINQCYGDNFSSLINRFRIERAKELILQETKNTSLYNLTYIWEESGFNNSVHFFRIFKSVTGMTPTEFKNSNIERSAKAKQNSSKKKSNKSF